MPAIKKADFFDSEAGQAARQALLIMDKDTAFNTYSSYTANAQDYPDYKIPFVDKHMNYLMLHPSTDPQQYISNLRLMTRVR